MIKRLICLLSVLALCFTSAFAEEKKPEAQRYDFDLTFSLNPDALPARSRIRACGYAKLLDCLELRGDIVICKETESFDMNASLFFKDKPEVSIPFRFYGIESLLFISSPIIANQTLLFNMVGLAEFAIKVRKSLDTPLPAIALLYPLVYECNLWNIWTSWNEYTGPNDVSRVISAEKIAELADAWSGYIENDTALNVWMTALTSVSSAPEAVEAELNAAPSYLRDFLSQGEPLTVEINEGTETWQNAEGTTLFAKDKTDNSVMWSLTLPADENRYTPTVDYSAKTVDGYFSFNLDGSMIRGKAALPPGISEEDYSPVTGEDEESEESEEAGENEEEVSPVTGSEDESEGEEKPESEEKFEGEEESEGEYEEEEEDSQWPEVMIQLSASGDSIPTILPCDSSFSISSSVKGALYPNFDLTISGKTEKDGSVSVSFSVPQSGTDPMPLLSCAGTILPSDVPVETVPDFNYEPEQLYGTFNFFSFSEYSMAYFKETVTDSLVKGLLDFVAAAPTAACQSLLDDLTDSGILSMMMDQ